MPGINNTLSIARTAISAQQYGLNVSGHNIANVNNTEYSRQTLPMESNYPIKYGSLLLGTGVNVQDVTQVVNKYMELRLTDNTSNKSALTESQNYMNVMDSLLNENEDSSISSLLSKFWSSWQDLSNNPGGAAERIAVYEGGSMLSEELHNLNTSLSNLRTDLTKEINAGVSKINSIANEIADINQGILSQEVTGRVANDLRDKRTSLVRELGEYIDVQTFEQPSGSTIVTTKSGFTLIYDKSVYGLSTENDKIMWEGSYGNKRDITDDIQTGKLGGWLGMRDETIPKFMSDLESMTRELVWQTNKVHSEGAGIDYFDNTLTGQYKADDNRWMSSLDFGDRVDYSNDFKLWVRDSEKSPATYEDFGIDMGLSTAKISNYRGNVAGTGGSNPPYNYKFTVVEGGNVDDTSSKDDPVIQWEKYSNDGIRLNSGYSVINKGTVTVNTTTNPPAPGISFDIDTGILVAGNTFSINTNKLAVADPLELKVDQTAKVAKDKYTFKVTEAGNAAKGDISGEVGIDPITIEWTNTTGKTGTFTLTPKDPYFVPLEADVDGMRLQFNAGTMIKGDSFVVTTDEKGTPSLETDNDYKWTLDSFTDEFNRRVKGVTSTVSPYNQLTFEPDKSGYEISNIKRTGEIHLPDTRISVHNYSSLTALQKDMIITRDNSGVWSLSGITENDYLKASIIPSPLKVTQSGGAANAANATYTFDVTQGGEIGKDNVIIDWANDQTGATGQISLSPPLATPAAPGIDGMDLDFTAGSKLYKGDQFSMKTDAAGNASVYHVPADKGFSIDLTGNGIADIDIDFVIPVEGQGSLTFDLSKDTGEYSYAFSDNQSEGAGVVAAAGINTFFTGSDIKTMGMNSLLSDINYIAAAKVNAATRSPVSSDSQVSVPITITAGTNDTISFTEGDSPALTATIKTSLNGGLYDTEDEMDILASDIEKSLEDASYYGIDYSVNYNRNSKLFEISENKGYVEKNITFKWNDSKVAATLGFKAEDDTISPPVDPEEGALAKSDNKNALDLLNVQYKELNITQWAYTRGKEAYSEPESATIDGFYQGMVGGLGVQAVSIDRGLSFSETMVERLTQDRDTISGVSLDEEMINLMKYQHAFSVASKLLSISDEMLNTIVSMR